jgi:hypothetical protein
LYYALQLDQSLTWELHLPAWAQRGPQQVATAGLSLAILSGLLLATPYRREERHELSPTKPGDMELSLILTGTRHRIAIAPQRQGGWIVAEGRGHGMPGSGVKAVWTTRQRAEGGTYFQFKQRMSGWLTELDQANEILVPDTAGEVRVVVQSGAAEINLRGVTTSQEWKIEVAKGARCDWTTGDRRGTLHSGEVFHWNPE